MVGSGGRERVRLYYIRTEKECEGLGYRRINGIINDIAFTIPDNQLRRAKVLDARVGHAVVELFLAPGQQAEELRQTRVLFARLAEQNGRVELAGCLLPLACMQQFGHRRLVHIRKRKERHRPLQLLEELRVLYPARCHFLRRKLERACIIADPNHLYQPLLLQVEEELRIGIQYLRS